MVSAPTVPSWRCPAGSVPTCPTCTVAYLWLARDLRESRVSRASGFDIHDGNLQERARLVFRVQRSRGKSRHDEVTGVT